MRLTNITAHEFGHLGVKIVNQVHYHLSPFEQNVTKGVFSKGFPNVIRRTKEKFLIVGIPIFLYYNIYRWGIQEQYKMDRKDPKEYENDV